MNLPELALVERELAHRSLPHFIRQGWRYMDPADYLTNWHIDAVCEHLEAVTRGQVRHLIINIPPRHMKSLATSVAWPAWSWQADPDWGPLAGPAVRWLFSSYSQTLSIRDSVKCRRLLSSPWYRQHWGSRFDLTGDQNTKIRFDNTAGGYRLATSVDGALTGEGGDVIVVDDPHNATDVFSLLKMETVRTWWDEAMSTRLNDPKVGAYVIIMQRLHERDLTGHVLAKNHHYTHLCLPMRYEAAHPYVYAKDPRTKDGALIWPARIGETEAATLEEAGEYMVAGQLQQRPVPRGGGMFKREWFEIVDMAPTQVKQRVRGWDLASTKEQQGADPAYTASVRMSKTKDGLYYIEHAWHARLSPNGVDTIVHQTAQSDGKAVPVALPQDPGQAGVSQARTFKKLLAGWTVRCKPVTGSKELRASPVASQAEAGHIKLVRGPWNEPFLDEVCTFPNGRFKDWTDAMAEAFDGIEAGLGTVVLVAPVGVPTATPYAVG